LQRCDGLVPWSFTFAGIRDFLAQTSGTTAQGHGMFETDNAAGAKQMTAFIV